VSRNPLDGDDVPLAATSVQGPTLIRGDGVGSRMPRALLIGGTRFIGRHVVEELLEDDYDVTLLTRGNRANPFAADERVEHVTGDRTDESMLASVADAVDPDVVVDTVAYQPSEVETAVRLFADVDRYVYVSSIAAYDPTYVYKAEGHTPLLECTSAQAADDSWATYGNRKAAGDRVVFAAGEDGVPAVSVRPTMVYGPYNHNDFVRYWIDRVANETRVLVPGDGQFLAHRSYVRDIATAIVTLLESGEAGEAYNVADQRPLTIGGTVDLIADVLDRDVEQVRASERELERGGLSGDAFPLYMGEPYVMSTEKLAALGWESTPVAAAMERTIEAHREEPPLGDDARPSREDERRVLEALS